MNTDIKTAFLEHCLELHLQGKAPFRFLEEAFAVRNDLAGHEDKLINLFEAYGKEIPKRSQECIIYLEFVIIMYLTKAFSLEDLKYGYINLYKKGNFFVSETETRH